MKQTVSKNIEDTRKLAADFLQNLKTSQNGATVVCLSGDLGSGKTAFAKEAGDIVGIPRDEITSPTFVIMKIFDIQHPDFKRLIHIDAYRLQKESELINLGWNEMVAEPKNLILIEWPEMVEGLIPKEARTIKFTFVDEQTRMIEME
jgi:tRNA threonylcarbamoyladenosine biosynthesis protein TsaE